MKTATDNNQPINKISYRQQLSTLQNESLQKTKQRKKQNEAIAISPNEIDESTHCFRTKSKIQIISTNETCIGIKKVAAKAKIISRRADKLASHFATNTRAPLAQIY